MEPKFGILKQHRLKKHHIHESLKETALCGVIVGVNRAFWGIDRTIEFAHTLNYKHGESVVCKNCLKLAKLRIPVLDRLARL